MKQESSEILEVHNFLSIQDMRWEINDFNIITGDVGTGKSLCIKLVYFFEGIIPGLLVMPYEEFLKNLESESFFESLVKKFKEIFVFLATGKNKSTPFEISYAFTSQQEEVDVTIKGTGDEGIVFSSSFLKKLLAEWNDILQKRGVDTITVDGFEEVKLSLYNVLLKKFGNRFPMATIFVPASRAALAFGSSHTDSYLTKFKELTDILHRFGSSRSPDIVKTILKAEIDTKTEIPSTGLFLVSDDGRRVPIAKASSGQQEIVYVLLLLGKLGSFRFTYGKHQSIFIEEPEAHLFPQEQKQTIEFIATMYRRLKEGDCPIRFFITTHSPYVLNVVNNMMIKDHIKQLFPDPSLCDRIDAEAGFPGVSIDELSAIFINEDGTIKDMLDRDEGQIFPEKIHEISFTINNDTNKLSNLKNELILLDSAEN